VLHALPMINFTYAEYLKHATTVKLSHRENNTTEGKGRLVNLQYLLTLPPYVPNLSSSDFFTCSHTWNSFGAARTCVAMKKWRWLKTGSVDCGGRFLRCKLTQKLVTLYKCLNLRWDYV
jgi:hypothetical protein